MLSPFGPFNQSVGGGGGFAVRFGAVQPGGGGGGGGSVPFHLIQSVGGGVGGAGGAVPFWPIQSVGGGGGGIYVNFCYKGAIQSQGGGGGGGPWPPCPHSGDAYDWLCRPCLLGVCSAGALQALPMVIL